MTLTLELDPAIEQALEEKAQSAGVALPEYVMSLLESTATSRATGNGASHFGTSRRSALDAIPSYNTRAGLPEIEDTSRSGEPDIYGYSEREMESL